MKNILRLRRGNYGTEDDPVPGRLTEGSSAHVIVIDEDEKEKRSKAAFLGVSDRAWLNVLLFLLVTLGLLLVKGLDTNLPTPVTLKESNDKPPKFVEERARSHLEHLTSVGVRVSGSEKTDVTTVANLVQILNDLKAADSKNFYLDVDVQRPHGAFSIGGFLGGHTSVYQGIANVVAKLEARDDKIRSNDSVLVNCHFDSKPGAIGATDNMISCVTMLEVIRVLYQDRTTLNDQGITAQNTIIFLFNGAEELGLQGAHGFVKGDGVGHTWSEPVKCFINLEGAGSGGREILFQSGPGNSWILNAYKKSAPHPYGVVLAEEAFQMGLIPSDTDFRIFRDYKDIPGLDMAFTKNGWIYHTKWDRVTEIPAGSIQHMGDNTLGLVKYLGTLRFDQVEFDKGTNMVFFDVMGLFMIAYSQTAGMVINCVFAIIFLAIVAYDAKRLSAGSKVPLTIALLPVSAILAWLCGIAAGTFVGAFLNWTAFYKPFHSYPFLAVVLFGPPAIFAEALVYSVMWKGSQEKSWMAAKGSIAILLIIITFITRSAFLFSLILFFAILSWLCRGCLVRRFMPNKSWSKFLELAVTLFVGEFIPFLFTSYWTVTLVETFVPIQARSATSNTNIFMGLVSSALVGILICNGLCSFLATWKKSYLLLGLIFSIFVVNPLLVVGFIGKISYQEKTPMRLQILDTDITLYNADGTVNRTETGYFFWPTDPHMFQMLPVISETVPELRSIVERQANNEDCPDLYCSQPFLWPSSNIKKVAWLPNSYGLSNTLKNEVQMTWTTNPATNSSMRNLTLHFQGTTQSSIILSSPPKFKLQSWSLNITVPQSHLKYQGRDAHFLYVGNGFGTNDFHLTIILVDEEATESKLIVESTKAPAVLNVMMTGHFMHIKGSERFQVFLEKLPSWTHTMEWTAVVKQYEILI